jgi:murein DD-endopeptidase MepM/ murein hydrolase activator NlpD
MILYWPFSTSTVSEWPGGYSNIRFGIHMGTDFAVKQGTPLLATTNGKIKIYNGTGSGGWGIDINTPDGFTVRNWHMSRIDVKNGQTVKVGDVIGLTGGAVGTPGAGNSTGPHLHWEIRNNATFSQNGWIDPRTLNPLTFGQNPNPNPQRIGNSKMYLVQDTTGRGFIVTPNRMEWVQDPGEWEILVRILSSSPGNPDTFISNQLDAVRKYFV